MKIPSIRSVNEQQNINNNSQKTSFTGGVDALVNFWQFVDNSRALQFTVEDMLGTNIPRTYKGAMAGYKYTGEINVPALLQEAIREFLTGPTMCLAPIAVLALAKKSGNSANTHIDNIRNLTTLAQRSVDKNGMIARENYYKTVASDLLNNILDGKESEEDIIKIAKGLIDLEDKTKLKSQKGLTKEQKKMVKSSYSESLENLQDLYSSILKQKLDSYKDVDFLKAKYTINNEMKGATKFKNYSEYAVAYYQDLAKKYIKEDGLISASKLKDFQKTLLGKRAMVIISMIGITGVLMSFIPKIYTLASGGVNPNASAIYNEANKTGTKEAK